MDKIKAQIFEVLKTMASAYGKDSITQNRLLIYTEVLTQKLSPEDLKRSLSLVLETCEYFPSISKIIELTKGTAQDQAIDSSAKIIQAIQDFGSYQPKEAQEYLGNLWPVVEGVGGWKYLCSLNGNEIGILRAQLRDLSKVQIARVERETRSASIGHEKSGAISSSSSEAQGKSKLKLMNFEEQFRMSEDGSSRANKSSDTLFQIQKTKGES